MVRDENIDTGLISLVSVLLAYINAEPQPKPYLMKKGIKIIL